MSTWVLSGAASGTAGRHPKSGGWGLGRLPQLNPMSLWIHDPAEAAEIGLIDAGIDLAPFGPKGSEDRAEIFHHVIHHEWGLAWGEGLGGIRGNAPDRHFVGPVQWEGRATPILDVDAQVVPVPGSKHVRVPRLEEDPANPDDSFHGEHLARI